MPLAPFSQIAALDSFKALDPEKKRAAAERYWGAFEAENPEAGDYVAAQRESTGKYLDARISEADATPLQQRFLANQAESHAFDFALREKVARGEVDQAGAARLVAERQERNRESNARLAKTASLFTPEVQEGMAPAFAALKQNATRGGIFGSPSLDARVSDILPGGEKDAVKTSKDAYAALRKKTADDFHLEENEIDDVIRHQLDLQPEPVSRDAFGTPYIKNEVLAQGEAATADAINKSTLPWSVKEGLLKDLPKKLDSFKTGTLDTIKKNYPELARSAGLVTTGYGENGLVDTPVEAATPEDRDRQFQRVVSELNDTRSEQFGGGFAAGAAASAELLDPITSAMRLGNPGTSGYRGSDPAARKRRIEAVNELSSELNKSKTQLFGSDAAVFGQGLHSVAEAVGVSAMTAGAGAPIAAERIAGLGKWGARLANSLNRATAVLPVAGLAATKTGVSTYEQAIAAGLPEDRAGALAAKSAAIEFGVTTGMSALGLGGLEEVGGQLTGQATKSALREGARKAFDSFGGKLVLGVGAEQFEENLITALDAVSVQAKINPNMTVDDLKQQLYDTAKVTLLISGPAVGLGAIKNKPTYEQPTDELKLRADLALAEAAEPGAADPLSTGADAPDPVQAGDLAPAGAPALDAAGGDNVVREIVEQGGVEGATPVESGEPAPGLTAEESPVETVTEPAETLTEATPAPETITPTEDDDGVILEPEPVAEEAPALETPDAGVAPETAAEVEQEPAETLTGDDVGAADPIPAEKTQVVEEEPVAAPSEKPVIDTPSVVETKAVKPDAVAENTKTVVTPEDGDEESPTGMRNAIVDAERKKRGLPERFAPGRVSNGDAWDAALKRVDSNPDAGSQLVDLAARAPRALDPVETALFTHEQLTREQAVDEALDAVNKDPGNLDAIAAAERAETRLLEAYDVGQRVGTASGRSLQARKLLVNRDFSLPRMLAREQAIVNQGKPLSSQQRDEVKKLHERIVEVERRNEELEGRVAQFEAETTFKNQAREFKKQAAESRKRGEKPQSFLDQQAEAAKARILERKRQGRLQANLDPADLLDHAIVGVSYIAKGVTKVADFTNQLVKDFGAYVREHGPEIFKKSQELSKQSTPPPSKVKSREEILSAATPGEVTGKMVYDLARARLLEGSDGFENVMAGVLADLKPTNPELTLREVHDIYSGYGKVKFPSKAEDKVKLREYRALARMTSQLEDAQKGLAPLKSGPQRDAASERVRTLQKQVKAEMRRQNIKPPSSGRALRSGLDAAKARLRNAIEELEEAIKNRTPRPANRTAVEYDEEAKALQARRDALQADYDAIFEKPGLTDKERVSLMEKSLTRRIAEDERLLAQGLASKPKAEKQMGPWTPELARLQTRLDETRAARQALRVAARPLKATRLERATTSVEKQIERLEGILKAGKLPATDPNYPKFSPTNEYLALIHQRGVLQDAVAELKSTLNPRPTQSESREQATLKSLAKAIGGVERRIRYGDFSPRTGTPGVDSPRVAAMKEQRQKLSKQLTAIRSRAGKESATVRNLEKSIAALEERIKANDIAAKPKDHGPDSAQVAALRENRAVLQKALATLKRAARPKLSPDEARLRRDKAAIRARMRRTQKRIDENDYAPAVKPPPVMDNEKAQLQLEEVKLKHEFNERLLKARLDARSRAKVIWDTALDVSNAARSLVTSADVSAVLRQGGFLTVGNPVRGAKAIPTMFKSGFSDVQAQKAKNDVERNKFYALSQRAKLFLSDFGDTHTLQKQEEAFKGRLIKKVPLLRSIVNFSERAYVSYLNKLRMDTFEAMVKSLGAGGVVTDEEAKVLANFINIATGRGNLHAAEKAADTLAAIFFSPKYVASRFQLLATPLSGFRSAPGATARTRKAIAAEYGKTLIGLSLVYALYGLMQDDEEVEWDPRSSDFGKLRFGNTRVDPLMGLSQSSVLLSRLATGETSSGGKVSALRGDDAKYGKSAIGVLGRFLRTKLAPIPSTIGNFIDEKDVVGNKVFPETELLGNVLPLSMGDIYSTMQEQGVPKGTALSMLSLFGVGVQTYGGKERPPMEQDFLRKLGVPASRYENSKKASPAKPKSPPKPKMPKMPAGF